VVNLFGVASAILSMLTIPLTLGSVVAIPFGVGSLFAGPVSPLGVLSLTVSALVGLLAVAAVSVPTMTFLRYHSLAVHDRSTVAFRLR
jgi:hypothetical protein